MTIEWEPGRDRCSESLRRLLRAGSARTGGNPCAEISLAGVQGVCNLMAVNTNTTTDMDRKSMYRELMRLGRCIRARNGYTIYHRQQGEGS